MNWGNRDWIWLFITALSLSLSFYIKNPGINQILSFISSVVSISLAAVAIYISVREATKTDSMKSEIHSLLGELKEKVGQIDTKLNNIDKTQVQKNLETEDINKLARMLVNKEKVNR
jgi:voltage-gated potassium channel Kch